MFTLRCIVPLAIVSIFSTFANANGLGPADGFTIFTIESYQANNTDCTGRVAVGGPATYNNFGVGSGLTNSNGTRDDLIVAGNLTWNNGQIFYGNIQAAGPTSLLNVGIPNGNVGESVLIDFEVAEEELQDLSDELFFEQANGSVSNNWGQLSMVGTDSELNVFALNQSDLHPLWGMTITVPEGSTVLVNVNHHAMQLNNFQLNLSGCSANDILWNFPIANSVQMNGIGWKGTILAPKASIQFNNGQIDGALVCRLIQGNGESHHAPFNGVLPTDEGEEYDQHDVEDPCGCCCHHVENDAAEDPPDGNYYGEHDTDGDGNNGSGPGWSPPNIGGGTDGGDCNEDDDDCECDCDCNTPQIELLYD